MDEADMPLDATPEPPEGSERKGLSPKTKIALVMLFVASVWGVGYATGLSDEITSESVRTLIGDAGPYGIVVFTLAFVLAHLVHMPGMLFVAASIFAWGPIYGSLISAFAGTLATCVNFFLIRKMAGQAFTELKNKWMKKVLGHLDEHPLLTVVVLRAVFLTSAQLSVGLGMSNVRARHHALGSAVGMTPIMFGWGVVFPLLFSQLGIEF